MGGRVFVSIVRWVGMFAVEFLIRGYQLVISPLLIGHCKFVPSCSDYFLQAVREWGLLRGSWLGVRRLARCLPFGTGGIDPVPTRRRCPDE